jgi:hypothetical protein
MIQFPAHIKILQAHSRRRFYFIYFFLNKIFALKCLALHLRSRSLKFFNHVFVAQNRLADKKGTSGSHFGLKHRKRRRFLLFFSAKSFGSEFISEGKTRSCPFHARKETTGLEQNCGS